MKTRLYRFVTVFCLLAVGAALADPPHENRSPQSKQPPHWKPDNKRPIIYPGHHISRVPRGAISFSLGGVSFFFHTGIFYRWDNGSYVVVSAPIGATVPVLPTGCSTVFVGGETYYVLRDSYFRRVPGGYRVVHKPTTTIVVQEPVTTQAEEDVTVWVQNDNGSRTPVRLQASGDGQWIGPKGEYYSSFPSETQLKPVYGVPGKVESSAAGKEPRKQIVWIENMNGSSTPVELEQQTDGTWKGPLGEIYNELPSSDDLRSAYGLD